MGGVAAPLHGYAPLLTQSATDPRRTSPSASPKQKGVCRHSVGELHAALFATFPSSVTPPQMEVSALSTSYIWFQDFLLATVKTKNFFNKASNMKPNQNTSETVMQSRWSRTQGCRQRERACLQIYLLRVGTLKAELKAWWSVIH